jgi:hypothetical protein
MTEYFGIPYPPAHTNLIQMMVTLKVIVSLYSPFMVLFSYIEVIQDACGDAASEHTAALGQKFISSATSYVHK